MAGASRHAYNSGGGGQNLSGIPPGTKTSWPHEAKRYKTQCDSVNDYIFIISNSHHYEEFRKLLLQDVDYIQLANALKPYSENKDYSKILIKVIRFVVMRNT